MCAFSKISIIPIMFELVVEATYPVDQAASFSLILFSNSIQGTFLMAMERILYRPLSEDEMEIQVCADKEDTAHEQAKDYLPYMQSMVVLCKRSRPLILLSVFAFFLQLLAFFPSIPLTLELNEEDIELVFFFRSVELSSNRFLPRFLMLPFSS